MTTSPHLNLLKDCIDITRVPFSDRGSRLLLFQTLGKTCLQVKLAERLTRLKPGLDIYRRRPPFIHGLCLVDEEGAPLAFETVTYPHAIYFCTHLGDFGLVFQDTRTLSFGLPPGVTAGLRFHVSPQFWESTERGGVFKSVHDLAYESNGQCVCNRITPDDEGYTVEIIVRGGDDCVIALAVHESPNLSFEAQPFSISCAAAEARWHNWFDRVPRVDERYLLTYTYAWWVMANNLISPQGSVAYESMMPSKINYVGLWLWDSAMHTLAYRHVDLKLARDQLRAMLACQLPSGMLPDAIYDEGVIYAIDHPICAQVTKPPILAWAALKMHKIAPDLDFLREIYFPLVRWNAWWFSINDDDVDGLAQYNHPYSSGLDDSPLWDYGIPVESPDLNTYLCIQMDSLAEIAQALGMDAEAAMWRRRAAAIVDRMIENFWDEEAGLFQALYDGQSVPVVTPFNLYPLWTGRLPSEIRDRLIAHLTNPDKFWGRISIPTVARDDPHYDPERMWRGPVWTNINYFFIEALRQVGWNDLASTLCEKTLELVMRPFQGDKSSPNPPFSQKTTRIGEDFKSWNYPSHPGIYEYYNSQTGQPPATAAEIFGWTAATFIDLAIQASAKEDVTLG